MTKNDPATYREMSIPHEDTEVASKAFADFGDDVYAARLKHRIRDVVVIVQMAAMTADKQEGTVIIEQTFGAQHEALPMLAMAFGRERKAWEDTLAQTITGKKK